MTTGYEGLLQSRKQFLERLEIAVNRCRQCE
jgi:hypothetical protein